MREDGGRMERRRGRRDERMEGSGGKNVGEKRRRGGREEESERLSGGQNGKDTTAGVWGPCGEGLAARRQKRGGGSWQHHGGGGGAGNRPGQIPALCLLVPLPQGGEGAEKGWQDPSPTDLTSHFPRRDK